MCAPPFATKQRPPIWKILDPPLACHYHGNLEQKLKNSHVLPFVTLGWYMSRKEFHSDGTLSHRFSCLKSIILETYFYVVKQYISYFKENTFLLPGPHCLIYASYQIGSCVERGRLSLSGWIYFINRVIKFQLSTILPGFCLGGII